MVLKSSSNVLCFRSLASMPPPRFKFVVAFIKKALKISAIALSLEIVTSFKIALLRRICLFVKSGFIFFQNFLLSFNNLMSMLI